MGEKLFTPGFGLAAGTKIPEYKKSTKPKKGQTFAIVDTPGLFDPEVPDKEIVQLIVKASACLSPGAHAVLYVLKIDRYTPEQRQTFMRLKELFDENIVKYTIIIFTGGDELKKKKMTKEQLLEQAGEPFKEVMRECGNRMVVFNNEDKGRRDTQVKELLALVETVQLNNSNEPYHCKVQEVVNTELKRRVTVRTEERIQRDPKLKKVFDDMAMHAKQARELSAKHHHDAEESFKKSQQIKKIMEEEKRREQEDKTAQDQAEQNRKAQEEKEKQEQARKQQEDEHRKQKEQEQKQRDEEEKKRKSEEEKRRKEKEAEAKKKMEELQKQLRLLEIERESHLKLEAEKEKIRQEYEAKLEAERKKQQKEETEKTKHDVVEGKEKNWMGDVVNGAAAVAGGVWRAARGWFGV